MGNVSVGQSVPRYEDPYLLRGEGRYTADVTLPGQAYGYVLRSPHAFTRINGIDTSNALAAPGVLAVLTGADMEADEIGLLPNIIPPISPSPTRPMASCRAAPTPLPASIPSAPRKPKPRPAGALAPDKFHRSRG
jgi:CO/xanthine dehydrogenase Mo-binding subunit